MTDPAAPDHVTGAGLPAEATGERPGPFSVFLKVLSAALSGGLVVLLFAAIIPKVTEFESVGESIRSIAPATVVLMLIMALGDPGRARGVVLGPDALGSRCGGRWSRARRRRR